MSRSVNFMVRLTVKESASLKKLAKAQKITASELIRQLLEAALAKEKAAVHLMKNLEK